MSWWLVPVELRRLDGFGPAVRRRTVRVDAVDEWQAQAAASAQVHATKWTPRSPMPDAVLIGEARISGKAGNEG